MKQGVGLCLFNCDDHTGGFGVCFPFFDGDDVSSKVPYSCRDQRV